MSHDPNQHRGDEIEPDLDDLARYVAGECSARDAAEMARRIASDPALGGLVANMRAIWENARVAPSGWDAETAWRGLSAKLDAGASAASTQGLRVIPGTPAAAHPHRRPPRRRIPLAVRLAAVLAAVAVGGVLYQKRVIAPSKPDAREFATGVGERAELRLEDGTRITVGVASRLRVAAGYGHRERRVELEGAALFDVPHDADRPFVVQTAQGVAKDLGTRFDVRAYPGDTVTQVVVAEGRVALKPGHDGAARSAVLEPGELGQITAGGEISVRGDVDVARRHAWADGQLVFEATPLGQALPELSRWYELDFRLADTSLARLPLTATFRNQPTAEVLELIALSLDLRLERRAGTIIFHAHAR